MRRDTYIYSVHYNKVFMFMWWDLNTLSTVCISRNKNK